MKQSLVTLVLLIVGIPCLAEQSTNCTTGVCYIDLPIEYFHWRSSSVPYLTIPERFGVWVSVWISDPDVEALKLTLTYQNSNGYIRARTIVVQRFYKNRSAWTAHLFEVGRVRVESILVVPLIAGEVSVQIKGDE